MNANSFWYLENIDASTMLCPQKMDAHSNSLNHKTFKKGESIYLAEEYADKIYLINEGRVKIGNTSEGGKEITKAILSKGEIFGELVLVGVEKRRDFAIALEDTEVCILTVAEMKSLMREHSGVNLLIMKIMGSRILEMENRLESLVFKDSRTRIIEFLRALAAKKGERVGYETVVRKFLTHQQIANLTATSRQTVTTVLNELRSNNIIAFNRRRLLIRDLDKLKEVTNKDAVN